MPMLLDLLTVANPGFDVEAATRAYLDTLQGPARAQSDAYFTGGYWLILWGALIGLLSDWLLLHFRIASGIRAWLERRIGGWRIVTLATALGYMLLGFMITLPWAIYTGFFRERQYGLMNQDFGAWSGEQATSLGISLVFGPLIALAIYATIRRSPRRWWLWATGVLGVFLLIGAVLGPVFIAPLFNTYTELPAGPLRARILDMAARQNIPASQIYVFDQSQQDKRISANVSGLGPTIRISLNDNLLTRTSDDEVVSVMGHEMGHYKMGHIWILVAFFLALIGFGLFLISRIAPWLIRRHGARWGVRDLADPASLPVLGLCLGAYLFLATPLINTATRIDESQADAFGLDVAQEPDANATVDMRLSEYRKLKPGPIEEALFFDHPSGATRVRMAMEWKKAHVPNAQIVVPEPGYLDATPGAK